MFYKFKSFKVSHLTSFESQNLKPFSHLIVSSFGEAEPMLKVGLMAFSVVTNATAAAAAAAMATGIPPGWGDAEPEVEGLMPKLLPPGFCCCWTGLDLGLLLWPLLRHRNTKTWFRRSTARTLAEVWFSNYGTNCRNTWCQARGKQQEFGDEKGIILLFFLEKKKFKKIKKWIK